MGERILVVAFDGLDYERIQEYGLTHIPQKEFGRIDNDTGIRSRKTAELFTSFITGETWEEHGVVGLKKSEQDGKEPIVERMLHMTPATIKDRLHFNTLQTLLERVRPESEHYTRDDIQITTIFDDIPGSQAVNMPVYSNNTYLARMLIGYEIGFGTETVRRDLEAEHTQRRKETFDAIEREPPLVISHFFYPDTMQHLYPRNEDTLKTMYQRIDDLAAEISKAAQDRFDTVIFMSDHGIPTKDAHNTNAFYSCNADIGLNTPHITDFYDLLKTRVEQEIAEIDL